MKHIFLDREIKYDGTELCSHWIFGQTNVAGDAIASFIGPADVPTSNMADLEDVKKNAPIFSKSMLHFIVEHFDANLELAVARQRLLAAIIAEGLLRHGISGMERQGDDIFIGGKKLSVSIATASPVSTLIHFALNVTSEGTPVPTIGLSEIGVEPKKFGPDIMRAYCDEVAGMQFARCKVRPVP